MNEEAATVRVALHTSTMQSSFHKAAANFRQGVQQLHANTEHATANLVGNVSGIAAELQYTQAVMAESAASARCTTVETTAREETLYQMLLTVTENIWREAAMAQ
ncbi:hypothetical protein NESM_000884500 [Novymonas esmeraldas]|uniref:Uncharacterized protein n=1 Tax=Novymonas esmeraldas TaxID=1808958 RepID=A0AAW0EYD4_9TRYP